MILVEQQPMMIDPAQTRSVQELKNASPLLACRFDPSGQFAFSTSQDFKIQRWNLADGKKTDLAGHQSWVRALAFHPTEKVLYSGGYEGKINFWASDAEQPTPVRSIDAHKGWVRALSVSPDGKLLASAGNDCFARVWSTADGKLLHEFAGHASHVYNVAFHPKEPCLISCDLKGALKQWDLQKGAAVRDFDGAVLHKYDEVFLASIGGARGLAFSADGATFGCAGITDVSNAFAGVGKPVVVLFDWQSGKRTQLLRHKEDFTGTCWGVVFHPEGFVIGAGGGNGGALWFWKPDQPQALHTVKLPQNARDLALHPDGKRLGVPCSDGVLRIYDMTPKPATPAP